MIPLYTTGGTIASAPDATGGLSATYGGAFLAQGLDLEVHDLCCVPSPELGPFQWDLLATAIQDQESDLALITHGTDTMEYTAAALHFALAGWDKTVVLTGAMHAPNSPHFDGAKNLKFALRMGQMLSRLNIRGVFIAMMPYLWLGARAQKRGYEALGFETPFRRPVGRSWRNGQHLNIDVADLLEGLPSVTPAYRNFARDVGLLHLTPFTTTEQSISALKGLRALILHSYGAGGGPLEGPGALERFLDLAAQEEVAVINTTAAADGVDLNRYANGRRLQERGLISGTTHTTACALAKASWALSLGYDLREIFAQDVAGETLPL